MPDAAVAVLYLPTMFGTTERTSPEAANTGPRGELLTIDTPVVDSEGSLEIEVGFADIGPTPASETLKPLVSAILTEVFVGTLGPLATGVCFATIPASLSGGFRQPLSHGIIPAQE